jgi:hypothetical protein
MHWRMKLILCSACILVPLLAAAQFFADLRAENAEATMTENRSALERIRAVTGLDLPPETGVVGVEEGGAIDSHLSAKLALAPSALEQFLASLGLAPDAFAEGRRYFLGTNQEWWDPQAPPALPTAQIELSPGRILNIGIDRSDPQRSVVYLFWHTT